MIERGVMFAADGMYEMQCDPDTFEIGDLVEVVRAAEAEEDRIRKTSDKEKAIGAVALRYAEPTSRVRFIVPPELLSTWDDPTGRPTEEADPTDVQHLQDCLYAISLAVKNDEANKGTPLHRHIERILSTVPKTPAQDALEMLLEAMGVDMKQAEKLAAIDVHVKECIGVLEGAETEEDASGLLDRCRRALVLLRKMTGGAS